MELYTARVTDRGTYCTGYQKRSSSGHYYLTLPEGKYTLTELGLKQTGGGYAIPDRFIKPEPVEFEISADAYKKATESGYQAVTIKVDNKCEGKIKIRNSHRLLIHAERVPFAVRCVSADGSKHTSNYDDYGATIRYLDTPVVIKLESTSKGNRITWNPVGGNARYRVYVKSRTSWKALGDTYDTTFTHSSEGEGSIFAQPGVEYTYTVACLSYIGNTVTSPYNTDGWSIIFTGGASDYEIGDTNLDGVISIGDVTAIQRHLAEMDIFAEEQFTLADTNGDNKLDISDATHLQKYLAEFDGIVLGKQS